MDWLIADKKRPNHISKMYLRHIWQLMSQRLSESAAWLLVQKKALLVHIRHLLAVGVEIEALQIIPEQGHRRTLPLARGAEIRGSCTISAPRTQEGLGCAAQEGTGIGSIAHTLRSRMRLCHFIALTPIQPFKTYQCKGRAKPSNARCNNSRQCASRTGNVRLSDSKHSLSRSAATHHPRNRRVQVSGKRAALQDSCKLEELLQNTFRNGRETNLAALASKTSQHFVFESVGLGQWFNPEANPNFRLLSPTMA